MTVAKSREAAAMARATAVEAPAHEVVREVVRIGGGGGGGGSAGTLSAEPTVTGRRPPGVPSRSALRQLRTSVGAEAGIGIAVLIATAILVNGIPGRQAYTSPYSQTVSGIDVNGDKISVTIDLDPANVGRDTMHLYTFTTTGVVLPYQSADGSLVERLKGIGPVDITFGDTGPGHGTADDIVLPVAGSWSLTVQIHTDALTDYAAVLTIPVR